MKNKALQAVGDTLGDSERTAIAAQLNAYKAEINDIVKQTQWNGTNLLGEGSDTAPAKAKDLNFLTSEDGGTSSFKLDRGFWAGGDIADAAKTGLGLVGTDTEVTGNYAVADLTDGSALGEIGTAIDKVKEAIGQVGAFSARLSFKEEALTTQYTNTDAAYNRIMNADMAQEQVDASKLLILQQTSTAMLAQANSAPQFILSLFR
jgi:flagellin